ncbi:MAG: ATP-binding protein [Proteobacteria bacterium]|nr:ATP-binding protein [Pseudomonadota bacterium]
MPVFDATPDLSSLPLVREFVLSEAAQAGVALAATPRIDLVLEEALVNVAHHAYGGKEGRFEVECAVSDATFCCLIRDWGTPFNPLTPPRPDISASVQERAVGGLGILFVTTMSDACSYARTGDANELTVCFSLGL